MVTRIQTVLESNHWKNEEKKGQKYWTGSYKNRFCEISGFCFGVVEICAPPGCSAAWVGLAPTSHLKGSISPRKDVLTLEGGADMLPRNVGYKPTYTMKQTRRAKSVEKYFLNLTWNSSADVVAARLLCQNVYSSHFLCSGKSSFGERKNNGTCEETQQNNAHKFDTN